MPAPPAAPPPPPPSPPSMFPKLGRGRCLGFFGEEPWDTWYSESSLCTPSLAECEYTCAPVQVSNAAGSLSLLQRRFVSRACAQLLESRREPRQTVLMPRLHRIAVQRKLLHLAGCRTLRSLLRWPHRRQNILWPQRYHTNAPRRPQRHARLQRLGAWVDVLHKPTSRSAPVGRQHAGPARAAMRGA